MPNYSQMFAIVIAIFIAPMFSEAAPPDNAHSTTIPQKVDDPSATQGHALASFDIHLKKGDYVFLGHDTGTAGKDKRDQGIHPNMEVYINPDSKSKDWELNVQVQMSSTHDGKPVLKWIAMWRFVDSDGTRLEACASRWQTDVPSGKDELLKPKMMDVTKQVGVDGLEYFKIPYAKVNGEFHYEIIVITAKKELLPKNIVIPKGFVFFKWNSYLTVPVN